MLPAFARSMTVRASMVGRFPVLPVAPQRQALRGLLGWANATTFALRRPSRQGLPQTKAKRPRQPGRESADVGECRRKRRLQHCQAPGVLARQARGAGFEIAPCLAPARHGNGFSSRDVVAGVAQPWQAPTTGSSAQFLQCAG